MPNWTVCYNIVSQENNQWVGTGWEFFDKHIDAVKCYTRHITSGNCPSLRPFHSNTDRQHLGAVHIERTN